MSLTMKGKNLLTMGQLKKEEIEQILKTAENLKIRAKTGEFPPILAGKTLGMIFQKNSTRTRVSFEVGMFQLGGHALFLAGNELQLGRGETIADTAQVLSRYVDAILIRTFSHNDVLELAKYASVPVINALTDYAHPTQVLTDLFTIYEKKGTLAGLKMTYVGDGNNNMANSLLIGAAKVGLSFTCASPQGYEPTPEVLAQAKALAKLNGSIIEVTNDPIAGVSGADVLYTDVWVSMGQEKETEERKKVFQPFQLNKELLAYAKADAIVMHCLPAIRGMDITDEVMDGPQSVVFDQAENRMHTHKAIMAVLI